MLINTHNSAHIPTLLYKSPLSSLPACPPSPQLLPYPHSIPHLPHKRTRPITIPIGHLLHRHHTPLIQILRKGNLLLEPTIQHINLIISRKLKPLDLPQILILPIIDIEHPLRSHNIVRVTFGLRELILAADHRIVQGDTDPNPFHEVLDFEGPGFAD